MHKFGVCVPHNKKEEMMLDHENGNTCWQDTIKAETRQLFEHKVFKDLGKNAAVPKGYQLIKFRIVFDVKQSLKQKGRIVARGDMTDPPQEAVHSGVASLQSPHIVCLLAELNGLKLTGGDIGNAYLEADTLEKVCVCASSEFEPSSYLLVIEKALHGLHTSGAKFHAKFADTLHALGFIPTHAAPHVWTRDAGNCCEHVVVCIDDALTTLKDPDSFFKELQFDPQNYKLKNIKELKYHLGGDFFRDKDGTLCHGTQPL